MSSAPTFTLGAIELRRIALPLVAPFRTSFGVETDRDILLVRVELIDSDGSTTEGWGECVALAKPTYSPEYVDGAQHVMLSHLIPAVRHTGLIDAAGATRAMAHFHGHPMAKGAIEMAILDAQLRSTSTSFADFLGATTLTIPSGVSVGIHGTVDSLLATVQGYVDDGYVRIKLKIEPGSDIEHVAAVRDLIGPDTRLQVDANTAYRRTDGAHLARLDALDRYFDRHPEYALGGAGRRDFLTSGQPGPQSDLVAQFWGAPLTFRPA